MNTLKKILKTIPVLPDLHKRLRTKFKEYRRSRTGVEKIFTDIYHQNAWRGTESISGTGSTADQTDLIVKHIPLLFQRYQVRSMLDLPCGDFHWMQRVDLSGVDYIGGDIVPELINGNNQRYRKSGVQFKKLNLMTDDLPSTDLIFCRDCLVHLSFADARRALQNICRNDIRYLLTTTFTDRQENQDILTGDWRTLNLQLPPFSLPPPLEIINEGCTEGEGAYSDKSLGLWEVAELRSVLKASSR